MNSRSTMAQAVKGLGICLLLAGLLFMAGEVQTSLVDVGLVTKLAGEATYLNQTDQPQAAPVQAFMKVRQGDQFKLPSGSLVQLVYFDNGRQETWKGPVAIVAGRGESQAVGDKSAAPQPEVQILPTKVTKRMMAPGMPLPRSSMRYTGAIPLMAAKPKAVGEPGEAARMAEEAPRRPVAARKPPISPEELKELQEAEKVYQSLRQQTPADDFTPELFFLGVLAEYGQYRRMLPIIDAMLAKKPGYPVLKDLKNWAQSQPASPSSPASR